METNSLMKTRIFNVNELRIGSKVIGYLRLTKQQRNGLPHLEYSLIEEYWNQGIMSIELPKYLKKCKRLGIPRLIALVKKDNEASIKLLEKSCFIKIATFDDAFGYVLAQDLMDEIKQFNKKTVRSMVL
ncbi:MAG: Acetyltransferase domain [Pseudomonadota bacterium]